MKMDIVIGQNKILPVGLKKKLHSLTSQVKLGCLSEQLSTDSRFVLVDN